MKNDVNPSVAIPVIMAALAFPLIGLSRSALGEPTEVDRIYAVWSYVLFAFLALAAPILLAGRLRFPNLLRGDNLLFVIFLFLVTISSTVHARPDAFANLLILFSLYLCLSKASTKENYEKYLVLSAAILVLFFITAGIVLGFPRDRWMGGIHPNILGGCAVAAAFVSLFGPKVFRDMVTLIALCVSLLISSRYAMVAIAAIYLSNMILLWSEFGRLRKSVVCGLLLMVLLSLATEGANGLVGRTLELADPLRGLGSGASGRDSLLAQFLPQIERKPILGYGFRARDNYLNTHNGFLNLILENGIIAAGFFLAFFVGRLWSHWRIFLSSSDRNKRTSANFISGFMAITFSAMLQPQLLNFGDPFGFVVLVAIFSTPRSENNCLPQVEASGSNPPFCNNLKPSGNLRKRNHERPSSNC